MSGVNEISVNSLIQKLRTYCRYAGDRGAPPDFADFIETPAAREHGLGFLRSLSKEVDVWVRELLTAAQQDELVRSMRAEGVLETDLPSTAKTRAVRRLLNLKRALRRSEVGLIRDALSEWQTLSLSAAELDRLENLTPEFDTNRRKSLIRIG